MKQKYKDKQAILEAMRTPMLEPTPSIKRSLKTNIQDFEGHLTDLVMNGYVDKVAKSKNRHLDLYAISDKGIAALANNEFLELGEKEALERKTKLTQVQNWKTTMFLGVISVLILATTFLLANFKGCK